MTSFRIRPYSRRRILEVYADREHIQLDPVYQRISGVWDKPKQRLLIDSIINAFDLPKMYLHELMPPQIVDGITYRYAIIDGKQRLEAIWQFMSDELNLASDFRYFDDPRQKAAGCTYSQLATDHPVLRARFDRTELPIMVMQTQDEELVENMFSRLNEAVPLAAPEFRNALGGPMPRAFRELERVPYFQQSLPFETGRYRYLDLAAKFLFLLHRGEFASTKKVDLDNFVIDFKKRRESGDTSANKAAVARLMRHARTILTGMHAFFSESDELLRNVGWITLYFHMFRLTDGKVPKNLHREHLETFADKLAATRTVLRRMTKGEEISPQEQPDSVIQQFVNLGQSSNDGSAILGRYKILRRYLRDHFDVTIPDPSQ